MTDKPNIFLKKDALYDTCKWPIVPFRKGYAKKVEEEAKDGDLILIVVTEDSDVAEAEEQGKIMGVVEFEATVVESLDYVSEEIKKDPEDGEYYKEREFKWPDGIPITTAWKFDNPPPYKGFFSKENKKHYDDNTRNSCVSLRPEDVDKILSLQKTEIPVRKIHETRKIFIKKKNGYNPDKWPVVSFGKEGYPQKLIKEAKDDDLILIVVGEEKWKNQEDQRGKIMGVVEFERRVVNRHQYMDVPPDNDWPHAIPMTRAWKFDEPLSYREFFSENKKIYNTPTIEGYVALSPEDNNRISKLLKTAKMTEIAVGHNKDEINLHNRKERQRAKSWSPSNNKTAPITKVNLNGTHYTYIFRFENRDIWKIGYSHNADNRLKQVNAYVPYEFLGEGWNFYDSVEHSNANSAYKMEKKMLDLLEKSHKVCSEMTECSEAEIKELWEQAKK